MPNDFLNNSVRILKNIFVNVCLAEQYQGSVTHLEGEDNGEVILWIGYHSQRYEGHVQILWEILEDEG